MKLSWQCMFGTWSPGISLASLKLRSDLWISSKPNAMEWFTLQANCNLTMWTTLTKTVTKLVNGVQTPIEKLQPGW